MDLYTWFTLVVILTLLVGVIFSLVAYEWGKQQGIIEERRRQQSKQRYVIRAGHK